MAAGDGMATDKSVEAMRAPGMFFQHRGWGFIDKCPHCVATNIKRVNANQITCGSMGCRAKQNNARKAARQGKAVSGAQ